MSCLEVVDEASRSFLKRFRGAWKRMRPPTASALDGSALLILVFALRLYRSHVSVAAAVLLCVQAPRQRTLAAMRSLQLAAMRVAGYGTREHCCVLLSPETHGFCA